ncbi:hypothetical protein AAEX63_13740 [Luteococcus sp. H138]|uniref:hypothetical protein n=1 Tax=unclassified Luteococcus TaxID=2639923 RepID=UPI00313EC896
MNIRRSTHHSLATIGIAGLALTSALASTPVADAAPAPTGKLPAMGAGWSAVTLGRQGMLTMVSPTGTHYPVLKLGADWNVEAVSPTGTRVLVLNYAGLRPVRKIVDVRTRSTTLLKGSWEEVRFSNPSGRSLIARTAPTTDSGSLQRLSLKGVVQTNYAGTLHGLGMLPTQNGKFLVSRGGTGRLQVNGNATGVRVRSLPNPKGFGLCTPQHWLDANRFTAACLPTNIRRTDAQAFRYDIRGGAPVALTSTLSTKGALMFGYLDSWATPTGRVVEAASSCGPSRMGVVNGRTVNPLRMPDDSAPLAVVGTSVYYFNGSGCDSATRSISRLDLRTGRNVVLAGLGRDKQRVTSVAMVDARR